MKKGLLGLIGSILVFVFCISLSVSYAWYANNNKVTTSKIDISAVKYEAKIDFYKYENKNWTLIDSNDETNKVLQFYNLIPSEYKIFRIDITNIGNSEFSYNLLIDSYLNSNVVDENDPISDYMYMNINSISSLSAFDDSTKDLYDNDYNPLANTIPFSIKGVSNINNIKCNGKLKENETTHLIFKVYFSAYASVYHQCQGFEIKKIRIVG